MDTDLVFVIIQFLSVVILFISVILTYRSIKNNRGLNQKIIFNEVVRQERELRIKLSEYKKEMLNAKGDEKRLLELAYDTLLFNYYEYLAVCVHKNLIDEVEAKIYFRRLLVEVNNWFEVAPLFIRGFAERNDFPGIIWLVKRWNL